MNILYVIVANNTLISSIGEICNTVDWVFTWIRSTVCQNVAGFQNIHQQDSKESGWSTVFFKYKTQAACQSGRKIPRQYKLTTFTRWFYTARSIGLSE